jgi:hypothetical protein
MIVVTIELWPGGYKEKSRPLGVISITNDGTGTKEKSNYNYVLSHAGLFFGQRKEPVKKGLLHLPRPVGVTRPPAGIPAKCTSL